MKRVLIFEDQLISSMALEAMLRVNGYESIGAYDSADQAVDIFTRSHPDVILMDIMLNGTITGLDAAEQLRSISDVPILFLTALTDNGTMERIKSIKNADIYVKPYQEDIVKKGIPALLNSIE